MKTFIDFVYTLLIGASVALFVGLGIWTFYSGPKMPEYPQGPYFYSQPNDQQQNLEQQQQKFDRDMKQYQKSSKHYDRNVAAISLAAGVIVFAIGLLLIRVNDIVGEGLALGGAATEVYAAIRATMASNKPLVFASICLILVMMILLALFRRRLLHPLKLKRA
jgi:hypothetical protein